MITWHVRCNDIVSYCGCCRERIDEQVYIHERGSHKWYKNMHVKCLEIRMTQINESFSKKRVAARIDIVKFVHDVKRARLKVMLSSGLDN